MTFLPAEYVAALTFAVIVVAPAVVVIWQGVKQMFLLGLPPVVNTWAPRVIQVVGTIAGGLVVSAAPLLPLVAAAVISVLAPGWAFDFVSANKKVKDGIKE